MTEIGYTALFLALILAVYAALAFLFGAKRGHASLLESARSSLLTVCGLVSISTAVLVYALLSHDFQIEYVANYTSRDLSISYLISSLWAGNDGSLLFWAWLLSICAAIVVLQKRDSGKELIPYASSIIMFTQAFFLVLLLFIANPFHKLPFVPADGRGLNPLLENPGMFFHPPLLLAGYVGFTVPFAFAIAALLTRRLRDEWIIAARRWTILAWLVLGIGNLFGAWWAYVELGWGGFWAWDPVENASFLPWLTATALLHSIMMQRRRGILKKWNMFLIIITFTLSILGTFLTRSGVLSSVHTFAESPLLGAMYLAFISVTLVGSLFLVYYRSWELRGEAEMESLVSRESTFLLNNLLLVGAAFTILLGTFFPIISEAVRGVKVSVGPPFYNQVMTPIFLGVILLAGICALIGWRRASIKNLVHNFLWPAVASFILGIVLFIGGIREWYALIALPVCGLVFFTIVYEWFRGVRARHRMKRENYLKAFWRLVMANRPRYGGYIVHIGVILFTIGVVGSSYNVETEASIAPGDSMTLKNYTLTYENMDNYETASKEVVSATLSVYNGSELLGKLTPEKYFHRNYEQSVTEVAIRSTLFEDLYVILVGWDNDGTTAFKVIVNPLVSWLWIGGIVLTLGGLIAFWPERRRPALSMALERRQAK
ncbi:MAG: heme lyase CcmF/NrfE family subunit [Dehalococcoidales bacterium]|nr:heme lyase CcmF/NrfE family subunit [Dehalococcoidales bacterium]